jgi:hypothetical protein
LSFLSSLVAVAVDQLTVVAVAVQVVIEHHQAHWQQPQTTR